MTPCQVSGHRFNEDGFCPDCGEHTDEVQITPFNWHEADRDSFAYWAVIAMISDGVHPGTAEAVLKTGPSLRIRLDINGVTFNGMPFFERLWQEMQRQADIRAVEIADKFIGELVGTKETVEMLLNIAAGDIRRRFREAGLPMTEPEEDY